MKTTIILSLILLASCTTTPINTGNYPVKISQLPSVESIATLLNNCDPKIYSPGVTIYFAKDSKGKVIVKGIDAPECY